jgi:tRNA-modifying protein YgfZ
MMTDTNLPLYYQAAEGCGLFDQPHHTRIWSTGRDRIDLIHRMSTNDLVNMTANEGRATVLTTAVARMVDRLVVVNLGERALVLGSNGTVEIVRRWLSSYIFFNDDVKFTNAATDLGQFVLFGPKSGAVAEQLAPGASGLKLHHAVENSTTIVVRGEALLGESFVVLAPEAAINGVRQAAVTAGAVVVDEDLYEVARVESGLPEYGHEIGEGFIPLEAGLWSDISFSKGCYIGQEIIARMESRGKLAKTMVGVQAGEPLAVGGTLTSVANSPRYGWIGLAFVKPANAEPGAQIEAGGTQVTVATIPFQG